MSVRYAWSDDPSDANLINKDGLPASPFRAGENVPLRERPAEADAAGVEAESGARPNTRHRAGFDVVDPAAKGQLPVVDPRRHQGVRAQAGELRDNILLDQNRQPLAFLQVRPVLLDEHPGRFGVRSPCGGGRRPGEGPYSMVAETPPVTSP